MRDMSIVQNKKAFHDYFIEERYEAGLMLEGWEVKAIRAGRVQIKEAYITIRDNNLQLFGAHISPLLNASTHIHPDPTRTRPLLLNAREIAKLMEKVQRAGYTIMPLDMHYKGSLVKLNIGLAKGKKLYDKREDLKKKDSQRELSQALKSKNRD